MTRPNTQYMPCFSACAHGDCPLAIMFTEELENTMITPKIVRMITHRRNPWKHHNGLARLRVPPFFNGSRVCAAAPSVMFGRLAEDVMLRLASGFPMLIHPTLSLLRELVSAIGVRLELVHGRAGRSHEHHIAGLRVGAGRRGP